jgi:4-diphosphocytidyl-2-C-methyl-D-erythritol kinase
MLLRAFAKINLDLRIIGKRPDGYHELRTILQTIDWCDEIHVRRADRFQFTASGMPADDKNLVVRAVHAFERTANLAAPVEIHLVKNLPVGAGLGGGSSDAAVTLLGLQQLLQRPLPGSELLAILRSLGSDVPFFAVGGRAVGVGRGDEVYPLPDDTRYTLAMVQPELSIATAEAYSWLTLSDRFNIIERFCAQFVPGSGKAGRQNDFESPVFERYPQLVEIRNELIHFGARRASLSGSGSVVFGEFDSADDASKAVSALKTKYSVRLAKPMARAEYFRRMVTE